jgi:hypothetical protein
MTTVIDVAPPPIVQICREHVTPGREADFRAIEEDAARICAELNCPNSHLAMESVTRPIEVWWITPYESDADRERVAMGYADNPALMAALGGIATRKQGVTAPPLDVVARLNSEASSGPAWTIAGARFFVAMATARDAAVLASVYESPEGGRLMLRPVSDPDEGAALTQAWGPGSRLFAVRPYWGMPAAEWIAADREFWNVNPAARRR